MESDRIKPWRRRSYADIRMPSLPKLANQAQYRMFLTKASNTDSKARNTVFSANRYKVPKVKRRLAEGLNDRMPSAERCVRRTCGRNEDGFHKLLPVNSTD